MRLINKAAAEQSPLFGVVGGDIAYGNAMPSCVSRTFLNSFVNLQMHFSDRPGVCDQCKLLLIFYVGSYYGCMLVAACCRINLCHFAF